MEQVSQDVYQKAKKWISNTHIEPKLRKEIEDLLYDNNSSEITDRFYKNLDFGTGGLRGVIGAGSNRINSYNIQKASFALAKYINQKSSNKQHKVAITYDSRNYSKSFAQQSAEVLAGCGIFCYITEDIRPVPMLSFMIRYYSCSAGICITASHNPKKYNGFKAYLSCGGQLVPPHDKKIIGFYNLISCDETIPKTNYETALSDGDIFKVGEDFDTNYLDYISKSLPSPKKTSKIKIVYTPLHGSGIKIVPKALKAFGHDSVSVVKEQADPDGDFPTVSSPNPEDQSSLLLAKQHAEDISADLVLATDPDADRLALLYKDKNRLQSLNGNQIAAIILDYLLSRRREEGKLHDLVVMKSIVTTDLLKDIANAYGVCCEETLTGFKWIGKRIEEYETKKRTPYKRFVYGAEESYGFLTGSGVRDKDAVQACCLISQIVSELKANGETLKDKLNSIFLKHGVYHETLYTINTEGKSGQERISKIMCDLRSSPPKTLGSETFHTFKDYLSKNNFSIHDQVINSDEKIDLPASNVLQLISKNSTVSIRPSGTEPKIKLYISYSKKVSAPSCENLDRVKVNAKNLSNNILNDLLSYTEST